jgi:hypothetical protein
LPDPAPPHGPEVVPPPDGPDRRTIVIAAVVGVVLVVAGIGLVFTVSSMFRPEPTPTLTPTAVPTATPEPTTARTARPTPPATPGATPTRRDLERRLTRQAPEFLRDTCKSFTEADDPPFLAGAQAAISCEPTGEPLVVEVAWFKFPDLDTLSEFFEDRYADIAESDLPVCDELPGKADWERGRVACFHRGSNAAIRWTDEQRVVYGVLSGREESLSDLYDWWSDYLQ